MNRILKTQMEILKVKIIITEVKNSLEVLYMDFTGRRVKSVNWIQERLGNCKIQKNRENEPKWTEPQSNAGLH